MLTALGVEGGTPSERAQGSGWLRCQRRRSEAELRLVCVPYAGGGASAFLPWNELLSDRIEIWSAHLPGREGRFAEPALPHMERVAGPIAGAVHESVRPPYALFGHSMGALVCYEVARALAGMGAPPRHLVVSAAVPPHLTLGVDVDRLDDDALVDWVTGLGGVPAELLANTDFLKLALPVLRSDLLLCHRYLGALGRPALDIPISAIAGGQDPIAPVASVAAWRGYTTARFELIVLDGRHLYLRDDAAAVPALLSRLLDRSRPE